MDASSSAIIGVITEWKRRITITRHWPNPSAAALAVSLILRAPLGFLEAKSTNVFWSTRKSTQDLPSVFPFTTPVVQDGVQIQPVYELLFPWQCELPSVSRKHRQYCSPDLIRLFASIVLWYCQLLARLSL